VLSGTGLLNDRLNSNSQQRDLNISTSSIHNFKTLDNLEREFEFLKEEYEGTVVTNKILNKSNLELKNQLKILENELNEKELETRKVVELNRTIEDLRATIGNSHKLNQDSNDIIQSLKQLNNELNQEINHVKASNEEIKNGCSLVENENEDLKKVIENNEINSKNMSEKILEMREKMSIK
jgi:septal ring factor EnvC (AmiA/AmiB activator)